MRVYLKTWELSHGLKFVMFSPTLLIWLSNSVELISPQGPWVHLIS